MIGFKTVWLGVLLWVSFSGDPAVVAAMCNGITVFCAVRCGAERLSGGSLCLSEILEMLSLYI